MRTRISRGILVLTVIGVLWWAGRLRVAERFYFTMEPAVFSPDAWQVAWGIAEDLSRNVPHFSTRLRVDRERSTTTNLVVVENAGGFHSVIFFETTRSRFLGPSAAEVEASILERLERYAQTVGDLGQFTALRTETNGSIVGQHHQLAGKHLRFSTMDVSRGTALLEKEREQARSSSLPDVRGPMQRVPDQNEPASQP